jgi:hypothetical protein
MSAWLFTFMTVKPDRHGCSQPPQPVVRRDALPRGAASLRGWTVFCVFFYDGVLSQFEVSTRGMTVGPLERD